jgi:transposase
MKKAAQTITKLTVSIPTDGEIKSACQEGEEEVLKLFHNFSSDVAQTLAIVKDSLNEAADQTAKDSHNSSKPPSSDGLKKPNLTQSLRKKSGKTPGGVEGHTGDTLRQVGNPDETIDHTADLCENCGQSLVSEQVSGYEKRQVFEIEIRFPVIEHKAEKKVCPSCGEITTAPFPQDVTQPVQYGKKLLATAVYLNQYQLVPLFRTQQIFLDLGNIPISQTTILKAVEKMSHNTEGVVKRIKSYLTYWAEVVFFDESGIRALGKLRWLHSAGNKLATLYEIHKKRGTEAMNKIGILPNLTGIAVHDHWDSYFDYFCRHSLCNAHHLRELTFIEEAYEQKWATAMIRHLLAIKDAVDTAKKEEGSALSMEQLSSYSQEYDRIIEWGLTDNPPLPYVKKRGRVKKTKPQNLLVRLKGNKEETLRFMYDFRVSFDNNLAERDIRMIKLRQKISGCFRTEKYAEHFCNIRSYLSTVHKHNHSVFAAVLSVFEGDPYIPEILQVVEP